MHAEDPEERMAIAVVSAVHFYFVQHPQGVAPGKTFLAEFLKPFIDFERADAALAEHQRGGGEREMELINKRHALRKLCSERITASGK